MATGINQVSTDDDARFREFVLDGIRQSKVFKPAPFYDHDADVLFYYGKDVPTYAKRLNSLLTLILATDDNTLAGIKVKSVRRLVEKLGALVEDIDAKAVLSGNKIKLRILLTIATASPPDDIELVPYEAEMHEQYGDIEVDADELCFA